MPNYFTSHGIRSESFENITAEYLVVGAVTTNPLLILLIQNTTGKTLFVSENGTDDHYELPAGTSQSYDLRSNAGIEDGAKATGTQFSVRGVSSDLPGSGKIIISGQYL